MIKRNIRKWLYFGSSTFMASSILVATVVGTSTTLSKNQSITNSINDQSDLKLINHSNATTAPIGSVRVYKNTSFSSLNIAGPTGGQLVLTGNPDADGNISGTGISRTDYFGNILWSFDPNIPTDLVSGEIDSNGNLISTSPGVNDVFKSSIENKMVVEARQDASHPNIFYLLLLPTNLNPTTVPDVSEINSNVALQGTVVVLAENLVNQESPYGIINVANITPDDMIKNYPSSWTSQGSVTNGSFTAANHPNYYDSGSTSAISLPWKVYITSLGNMYADNGTLIMAGGNGTIFNSATDNDVLSMGMFRINFNLATNQTASNSVEGFPYALILSGMTSTPTPTSSPQQLFNLPMGQDSQFHYVPRIAVSGLVSGSDPSLGSINNLSIVGTITIGTNADQDSSAFPATRTGNAGYPTPTNSRVGSNFVTSSVLSSAAASGNSYTVQTMFGTYLKLSALEDLKPSTNPTDFTSIMTNSNGFVNGLASFAWTVPSGTSAEPLHAMQLMYSLANFGGFSPRDVGNLIPYSKTNDPEGNNAGLRSYYFQFGSWLIKMYQPDGSYNQPNRSPIIVFSDRSGDFITTNGSSGSANYSWNDFKGSFVIGADTHSSGDTTIIGSGWSSGIYYQNLTSLNTPTNNVTAFASAAGQVTGPTYNFGGNSLIPQSLNKLAATNLNAVLTTNANLQADVQSGTDTNLKPLTFSNNTLSIDTSAQSSIDRRNNAIGFGRFKTSKELNHDFFTKSIQTITLTQPGNIRIIDPQYRSEFFDFTPPNRPDFNNETDWRLLVTSYDEANQTMTLQAQAKNPLTGLYTPISSQNSTEFNQAQVSGFQALPNSTQIIMVVVPVVIIVLIVIIGLAVGLPLKFKRLKALAKLENK